jgi:dihydroorotate dehydrogenase (NAD+) catalytic subunit
MARSHARPNKINSRSFSKKVPSIETRICGFKLHSPTMLASGILGISFDLFPRIIQAGCGAVVSKSIGLEPREGYANPTLVAVDSGYLNAIGLANPGAEEFRKELTEDFRRQRVPLIVSVFADSPHNFARLVEMFDDTDFLAYELNLSCPHVKDVGSEIGSKPEDAANVVLATRDKTKKPILAKMPATISNVPEWCRAVEKSGADAIVAINTVRAMKIEVQTRKPILSNKIGGLSGSAIKPIAVRCVYEAFESVSLPIIGVGGISNSTDALEFFLAGARAVQIGSAMGTKYLSAFEEINSGLQDYLHSHGFRKLGDIVGLAHK